MNDNFDEIDKLLIKHFNTNNTKEVPDIVSNKIKYTLITYKRYCAFISFIKKLSITAVSFLVITSSFVFADDIKSFFHNLFKYNVSSGVINAIDNGYVEKINSDYTTSNGVGIKADAIIMDDTTLNIAFNINLESTRDISKIYNAFLPNITIKDEQGRIIFAEFSDNEEYQNFCKENNLDIDYKNISYSNGAYTADITNKQDNNFTLTYNISSDQFPKSKELYISFDKIILSDNTTINPQINTVNSNTTNNISGNWNLKIDLPEKFYNRTSLSYKMINSTDSNLKINKILISDTCMKFEMQTKIDINRLELIDSVIPITYIDHEYVENSNGKKFYIQGKNDGDGGYSISKEGILHYWQTFTLNKNDATNTLKVILPTFGGNIITIELEKE